MNIIAVQNNAILNNKEANYENVEKLLLPYLNENADLIVLPEAWAIGWCCKHFKDAAETIDSSPTLNFLKYLAQKHKALVLGGSFIRKTVDNEYRNTMPVISKEGKLIGLYDKSYLFSHAGSEEQTYISKGNELIILNFGYTKIGLTICYDIRFPEVYREYSKRGVEIFVNVGAWGQNKLMHWEIMHKARAIENQCYMIAVDQTGKIKNDEYNLGHSMVISPWGDIISELEKEEACIFAKLDLEELKKLRKEFPLLADRRYDTLDIKEIDIYE